jgi:type IV pilus assembly protein PilC
MPLYEYVTLDASGSEVTDIIEADNQADAASRLRAENRLVLSIKESSFAAAGEEKAYEITFLDYLSVIRLDDLALFFRQLSSLLNSGVTLVNALYVLEDQTKKTRLKKTIGRIRLDIQGGLSLNDALNRFSRVFDERVRGMAAAGEASGTLGIMLERIADHIEDDASFRSNLVTGAIYPAIVTIVVVVVVVFLVSFVIPRITPLLKLRTQKLPWNTQLIIDVSEWFKIYWKYFFSGIGSGVAALYLAYRWNSGVRYWIDIIKTRIPVIGPVFHYSLIVQFTRNLSTLIGSGVSILESLRIVKGIISNSAVKRVMETMEMHILRGDSLSAPVKAAEHIFPPMIASMVAVGEETGSVDASLAIAADIHEKILKTYIQRMNAMIEPALILFLGVLVGFVAFAMISGILTMYKV